MTDKNIHFEYPNKRLREDDNDIDDNVKRNKKELKNDDNHYYHTEFNLIKYLKKFNIDRKYLYNFKVKYVLLLNNISENEFKNIFIDIINDNKNQFIKLIFKSIKKKLKSIYSFNKIFISNSLIPKKKRKKYLYNDIYCLKYLFDIKTKLFYKLYDNNHNQYRDLEDIFIKYFLDMNFECFVSFCEYVKEQDYFDYYRLKFHIPAYGYISKKEKLILKICENNLIKKYHLFDFCSDKLTTTMSRIIENNNINYINNDEIYNGDNYYPLLEYYDTKLSNLYSYINKFIKKYNNIKNENLLLKEENEILKKENEKYKKIFRI